MHTAGVTQIYSINVKHSTDVMALHIINYSFLCTVFTQFSFPLKYPQYIQV